MSAQGSQIVCLCGEPLRLGANFCARCGRELRQQCPLCFEEYRILARWAPDGVPWCETRGELLNACERCGRWLQAGIAQCPDPGCRGPVSSNWPATTGRAPDGAGRSNGWLWPSMWDRQNPLYRAPAYRGWKSSLPVHTAFVAHGRLYWWTGDALIAPETWPAVSSTSTEQQGSLWKCWLGFGSEPAPAIAPSSRAALLGGCAVLATRSDYVIAGLYPRRASDAIKLGLGAPITHVAADGWWAGWSQGPSGPTLWCARVNSQWRNTDCKQVTTAIQACSPRLGSNMMMCSGDAYWTSETGGLYRLSCERQEIQCLANDLQERRLGWCESGGIHTLTSGSEGIRVGLDVVRPAGVMREAPGGSGPIRDLFAADGLLAVVGDEVVTLDSNTGYALGGGKYTGQWVAGALAEPEPDSPDREPRLLMLTYDGDAGNLTSLRPTSGGEEFVWRGIGVKPTGMMLAGSTLYVVHNEGVVTIEQ